MFFQFASSFVENFKNLRKLIEKALANATLPEQQEIKANWLSCLDFYISKNKVDLTEIQNLLEIAAVISTDIANLNISEKQTTCIKNLCNCIITTINESIKVSNEFSQPKLISENTAQQAVIQSDIENKFLR